MKTTLICFVILLLSAQTLATYELLKLVQQWPPATCYSQTNPPCTRHPQNFTIHGLWPANYTIPLLIDCPSMTLFTGSLVKNLFPRINSSWPDLLFGKEEGFWKHEWEKHGTCSESKFNVLDYFKLALDIKDRVYTLKALMDDGIRPSTSLTYAHKKVAMAIQKQLRNLWHKQQVDPELRCRIAKGGMVYLHEVGLCLNSDGTDFISCPLQNDNAVNLCKNNMFKLLP